MGDTRVGTVQAVTARVQEWKAEGRKVVFTNGVFDVLHVGHVEVLERAAAEGDCLVVGVNSDASVKRLGKGADRPIHGEQNWLRFVAWLRSWCSRTTRPSA